MTKKITANQWLLLGARDGDMEVIDMALARGADLNAPCAMPWDMMKGQTTALAQAVEGGDMALVEALVEKGAQIDLAFKDAQGKDARASDWASMGPMRELLGKLSGLDPLDVQLTMEAEKLRSGFDVKAEALIDLAALGASVNAKNAKGESVAAILAEAAFEKEPENKEFWQRTTWANWEQRTSSATNALTSMIPAMDGANLRATLLAACKGGRPDIGLQAMEHGARPGQGLGALEQLALAKLDSRVDVARVASGKLAIQMIERGAETKDFFEIAQRNGSGSRDLLNRVVAAKPAEAARSNLLSMCVEDAVGNMKDVKANCKTAMLVLKDPGARVLFGDPLDPTRKPTPGVFGMFDSILHSTEGEAADLRRALTERSMQEAQALKAAMAGSALPTSLPGGLNPAHLALAAGNEKVAATLIEAVAGAAPEAARAMFSEPGRVVVVDGFNSSLSGPTPLDMAVQRGRWNCIPELAAASGRVNDAFAAEKGPTTLLHCAAYIHDPEHCDRAISRLLKAGADPRACNSQGMTAADALQSRGEPEKYAAARSRLEGAMINAELGSHMAASAVMEQPRARARSL
jgi:ankyrin repeat protein